MVELIDLIDLVVLLDLINLKDFVDLIDITERDGFIDVIDLIDLIASVHSFRTYHSQLCPLRYPPDLFDPFIFLLGPYRSSAKIEGGAIPPPLRPLRDPLNLSTLFILLLISPRSSKKMEGKETSYRDIYSSICSENALESGSHRGISKTKNRKKRHRKANRLKRACVACGLFLRATPPSVPKLSFCAPSHRGAPKAKIAKKRKTRTNAAYAKKRKRKIPYNLGSPKRGKIKTGPP